MIALLLVLTPLLPLALALAMVPAAWRERVATLLPAAPLPALALAVLAEPGDAAALPYALLSVALGTDGIRQPILLLTALLWTAAAFYSRGYFAGDPQRGRFEAFFLITMAGNLGLVVALDVATFYVFFSLMSLSSYILVVHERTPFAYAAGRVYIVLALAGETMLLFGLLGAASAAGSVLVADIAPALADERAHGATLFLLFAGFAIKAGLLPLHVWLPLAHPAAPTPASAVLSGAIIKAGLVGMMLLLPFGEAPLPFFGRLLTWVGIATAFYGVLAGLPQANPKTVLAYSSLSQMGLMVAALGAALTEPSLAPALLPAIGLYALHHGLAKGALFFAVGVAQRRRPGVVGGVMGSVVAGIWGGVMGGVVAGIAALSIAGIPFSAGSLAKSLLKHALEPAPAESAALLAILLPWSALATTLLMLRFLYVFSRIAPHGPGSSALLWAPFALTAAASQLLPWAIAAADLGRTAGLAPSIWENLWPIALAAALAGLALAVRRRAPRLRLPDVPEGDVIALLPTADTVARAWSRAYDATLGRLRWPRRLPARLAAAAANLLARAEAAAQQSPRPAALALLIVALLLAYAAV